MIRLLLVLSLSLSSYHSLASQEEIIRECAAIYIDAARLACYDDFANARVIEENLDSSSTDSNTQKEDAIEDVERTIRLPYWDLSRIQTDDPNFFGVSSGAGAASNDRGVETHIEFDISLKYPLLEWSDRGRVLFVYNGSYDFQQITGAAIYDSSPVISTSQNPGVTFEWDLDGGKQKLRVGYFHHSNGQTLNESYDDKPAFDRNGDPWTTVHAIEEFERVRNSWGEAPAIERVSRSSWYWNTRYQWLSNSKGIVDDEWYQVQVELRQLQKTDDAIFWNSTLERQPRLQQFDGVRFVAEKMIPVNDNFRYLPRIELQTGRSDVFDNVGGQLSVGLNFKNILGLNTRNLLFTGYYYSGFAKDIAFYHKRTKHMGFGLDLR